MRNGGDGIKKEPHPEERPKEASRRTHGFDPELGLSACCKIRGVIGALCLSSRPQEARKVAVPFSSVDLLQALSAGLLVGSAYALMCIGLGIIFGSMNVINFAQGDFLMLGMYAAFYLTAGYGVLTFLGPYGGPIVAAFLAGPIVFAIGWVLHRFIVARVTGAGVAQIAGAGA
jgi:Branched-chain amino acid transport system / permease component